jgi:hypothetical protein
MPHPLSLHIAQFYEHDEFLAESLVNFVKLVCRMMRR